MSPPYCSVHDSSVSSGHCEWVLSRTQVRHNKFAMTDEKLFLGILADMAYFQTTFDISNDATSDVITNRTKLDIAGALVSTGESHACVRACVKIQI